MTKYQGGPVLAAVEVTTVYVGINYRDSGGTVQLDDPRTGWQTRCMAEKFVADLLNSSYMDMLGTELRDPAAPVIGRGKWLGSYYVLFSNVLDPGQSISDAELAGLLEDQITNGTLQEPNENTCFLVTYPGYFSPPELSPNTAAWHSFFAYKGKNWPYIVVPDNNLDSKWISHEIAETVADPLLNAWGEIADGCENGPNDVVPFHHQTVSTICSPIRNACVGPVDDGLSEFGTSVTVKVEGGQDCLGLYVQGTRLVFTLTASRNGKTIAVTDVDWLYNYPPSTDWTSFSGPVLKLTADGDAGISVKVRFLDNDGCNITYDQTFVKTIPQSDGWKHALICELLQRIRYLKKDFRFNPIWEPTRDFRVEPLSEREVAEMAVFGEELLKLTKTLQTVAGLKS